ncbi:MAG: prepilin peptidase [Aquiluna sp.]|nr:prepilin peptidase [Aquiluna sp.]
MENLPLLAIVVVFGLSLPLAVIDFKEHRLPNPLTYSAIAVSGALVFAAGILTQNWLQLVAAVSLGLVTLGIGYLMAKVNGIGMGDVKYLVATNTLLGWFSPCLILVMLAIGFTAASLISLVLILRRQADLKTPLAMGPFLILGFVLVSLPLFGELPIAEVLS